MTIEDVKTLLPKNNWIDSILALKDQGKFQTISKDEWDNAYEEFTDAIDNNRLGKAIDWISLSLILNKDRTLEYVKRDGILRISSYLGKSNMPEQLISFLLKYQTEFEFTTNEAIRLRSLLNLSPIYGILKNYRKDIAQALTKHKKTIVKSLYSYIDARFELKVEEEYYDPEKVLGTFPNEEIAEGASYIIELYRELYRLTDDNIVRSDIELIQGEFLPKLIEKACKIKLIKEVEIQIEYLDHVCEIQKNTLRVFHPDTLYTKTYKLGNILLDMNKEGSWYTQPKRLSLHDVAKKLNEVTDEIILQFDPEMNRYVMVMHEGALDFLKEHYIKSDGYFYEEVPYLIEAENTLHLDEEKLDKISLSGNLTLRDILLVKRLFSIMSIAYFGLLKYKTNDMYYASNIPFLHSQTVARMLENALSKDKVDAFLNIFSYYQSHSRAFDMQYTPLLKGDDHFLVPYNVLINSNLFRNILFPLGIRYFADNKIDPISDKLKQVLVEKGFTVKSFIYKYGNSQGDFDLLAIKENYIFVFECKNMVLPVNAFEMRTYYSELKKAAEKQIPLAVRALSDKDFLKKYNITANDSTSYKIVPCIITTNRILSGYIINGYPVRNVINLKNFIKNGLIGFSTPENPNAKYCCWKNKAFSVLDLADYLSPTTKHISYLLDSMREHPIEYQLDHFTIELADYGYTEELLKENFEKLNLRPIDE